MVKIRLARRGSKKRPFYHIVAADSAKSLSGRYIEKLGFFNPVARGAEELLRVEMARVEYWVKQGAHLTPRVAKLLKSVNKQPAVAA